MEQPVCNTNWYIETLSESEFTELKNFQNNSVKFLNSGNSDSKNNSVIVQNQNALLDLIETIITYKFPYLTRDEVRKMLHIPDIHLDIRQTQFYKDVYAEGELKGELKSKIEVCLRLLTRRFGELDNVLIMQIKTLNLTQLDSLIESVLDFSQLNDLSNWLKQLTH